MISVSNIAVFFLSTKFFEIFYKKMRFPNFSFKVVLKTYSNGKNV